MNDFSILKNESIDYLNKILFDENKKLKVLPSAFYNEINPNHLKLFAHKYGIYSFPTTELAKWLSDNYDLSNCIEIGAGNGALAEYLGIKATDSKQQLENESIRMLFNLMGQPPVIYGDNVEKLEAIEAIKEYKPTIVLAQWVTHKYNEKEPFREGNMLGVDEQFIIDNVNTYIFIGNEYIHQLKPILEKSHCRIQKKWIVSRSNYPEHNIIYIWDKQ